MSRTGNRAGTGGKSVMRKLAAERNKKKRAKKARAKEYALAVVEHVEGG